MGRYPRFYGIRFEMSKEYPLGVEPSHFNQHANAPMLLSIAELSGFNPVTISITHKNPNEFMTDSFDFR